MFILTDRVLYIVKREITGNPVKMDPGKKVMFQQREQQILTGVVKVQQVHQRRQRLHGQRLRPPLAVPQPAVPLKEAAITGVEQAAGAVRAAVGSWDVNHKLAAKEASEHIHTARVSSSRKKVRPADQGALAQKALLLVLVLEVVAGRKAVQEVKKDVKNPFVYLKRTDLVVYHWVLFSFSFSVL